MNRTWNCFRPLPGGIAKFTVAMGMVLACGVGTRADYLSDRKAAMELIRAGKHEDALSAFLKDGSEGLNQSRSPIDSGTAEK